MKTSAGAISFVSSTPPRMYVTAVPPCGSCALNARIASSCSTNVSVSLGRFADA